MAGEHLGSGSNTTSVTRAWPLLLLFLLGCAGNGLTENQQACLECAVRAHTDPEAARLATRQLAAQCEAGEARSCSVLGVMYEQGQGVTPNARHAERLYRAACLGGNTTGCVNLGRLLYDGTARLDREGAAAVFEVACHGEHPEGCYQLGRIRYEEGDAKGAEAALARACARRHPDACFGLGAMYEHGHGVSADPARARRYYTKACARGHAEGCDRAARREFAPRDVAQRPQ